MKVYFGASVNGKKLYDVQYRTIVREIEKFGHEVLVHNFFETTVEYVETQTIQQKMFVHERLGKLKQVCDVVVMECSYRSFALGQEIAHAFRIGKPVLALYTDGHFPHLILSDAGDRLLVSEYSLENVSQVIADGLEYLRPQESKRFTMNIPSNIIDYLDRISREEKITRSDYLRDLILSDMQRKRSKKV